MKKLFIAFLCSCIFWGPLARAQWGAVLSGSRSSATSTTTVGYNVIGANLASGFTGDYLYAATKFTATHTGNITSIFIYSTGASGTVSVKLGLYADSGGSPGALVSGSPITFTTPGTWTLQWKEFTGFSIPVTSGTSYWFSVDSSESGGFTYYYDELGTDLWYLSTPYSSSWPNPYGTPDGSINRNVSIKATLTY